MTRTRAAGLALVLGIAWAVAGYVPQAVTPPITINGKSVSPGGTYAAASVSNGPQNPTGTSSTASAVMAGLNASITPATSGKVLINIYMNAGNSTINDGCSAGIRVGTGTAPTNGQAFTGTLTGGAMTATSLAANNAVPVTLSGLSTGLSLGVAAWIDVSFVANTGGTCTLSNVFVTAIEQ